MNAILSAMNPQFPAYATLADKLGWWLMRLFCIGMLVFLLLPILVIVPLSFSSSSFLAYPMPGWSLQPDIQYILHPGANIVDLNGQPAKNALVIGLRTSMSF